MPLARSTLKTGPAIVTFAGATFYFKTGLRLTEELETFEIPVDNFGKVDERVRDRRVQIVGTPAGEWEDLAVLWPWLASAIGTRAHGDTDRALVIHALDGTVYTYHNATLTQMPSLRFAATETLIGEVQWTARVKDNTEPSAANSLFTRSSAAFSDVSFLTANVKTQQYTLNWGSSPWNAFHTVDGVTVDFPITWQPLTVDGYGVVDQILEDIQVTARFRPLGVAQADIDAKMLLQGDAAATQGASLNAKGVDLVISGTGVWVKLTAAAAKNMGQEFGMGKLRNGEMLAVATRAFATGVAQPLAVVTTAEPT
jgi:hypothetical protein